MERSLASTGGQAVLFTLLLFVLLTPAQVMAEEQEKLAIWSTVPYFNWIKQTVAPLDQFSFFINGAQADSKTVRAVKHKDSLHVRLPLDYEKHTAIEIRHLGQSVYRADFFYAPSYESNIVPDESTYQPFHTADNEKPCRECHRLTVIASDSNPPEVKGQICYSCHQHKFDGMKSLHKPAAAQWRCLQCHQAEARPSQWSPDQPLRFTIEGGGEMKVAPLCYKCHKKFAEKVKGFRFQHGPIGMGGCNMCHNPHASNWPWLLHNNQTTLCINCHEFQEKIKKPVIHSIIKTKGCTPCHDPHGGQYPLQLSGTVVDQCTRCHPAILKQINSHPIQNHPAFIKAEYKDKTDKLSCVDCHSPHASDFKNLLPEEEFVLLCTDCHPGGTQ